MRKPITFSILYPVTDFSQTPPMHYTNLQVHATCYQHGDGSLLKDDNEGLTEIDIDSVLFEERNITQLLLTCAEDFYNQITQACRAYADKELDEYREDEIEHGAEASVHSEEWISAQAENQLQNDQY